MSERVVKRSGMQARASRKLVPIAESKASKKWRAQSEDRKLSSGE